MTSQTSLSPLPPLPSETLLQILGYLALPDLAWALRVNSSWLLLVQHHQQGIFKTMALAHGYLNEAEGELGMTLEQLGAREGLLEGVESWRDLCYRRRTLNASWSSASCLTDWKWNPSRDVWRLKWDREDGTLITSGRRGGITVVDEKTSEVLWRKDDIHSHAHCEFGEGYLVFDSGDGNTHEVYRRTADMIEDGQLEADETVASTRGRFSRFATLQSPSAIRAYRFVFPILLVGSHNAQEAYLFDVPSKTLVATINISSPDLDLINYVELTPSHILILGPRFLHVHSRNPPTSSTADASTAILNRILDFPSQPSAAEFSLDLALDFHPSSVFTSGGQQHPEHPNLPSLGTRALHRSGGWVRQTGVRSAKAVLRERGQMSGRLGSGAGNEVFSIRVDYNFTAVHVSGPNLVLASLLGKLFIILDYPAVFEDPSLQSKHTICLDVEEPIYNLAFEHGRAILTTKTKILLLNMSSVPSLGSLRQLQEDREEGRERSDPPLKLELYAFGGVSPAAVNEISFVQMNEQKVYISYYCRTDPLEAGYAPLEARAGVGFAIKVFDFSPEEKESAKVVEMVERRLGAERTE